MIDPDRLVFEVECAGFDGGSDETDDRILWVIAPSADELASAIGHMGASFCPIDMKVADEDIDFHLPKDIGEFWRTLQNFKFSPS